MASSGRTTCKFRSLHDANFLPCEHVSWTSELQRRLHTLKVEAVEYRQVLGWLADTFKSRRPEEPKPWSGRILNHQTLLLAETGLCSARIVE
jgi:hypothetical protein